MVNPMKGEIETFPQADCPVALQLQESNWNKLEFQMSAFHSHMARWQEQWRLQMEAALTQRKQWEW